MATRADPATTATAGRPHGLVSVLTQVRAAATADRIAVRDMVESLGAASFAPVLLLPALIVVSPLSGIPLLPTTCGLIIALVSLQMLFGRHHMWLPAWLLKRTVSGRGLTRALDWLMRPADWIDSITAHRLDLLVTPPASFAVLLACALAGLAMPLLEILPLTSSILGAAVTLMALGLLVRDGLVALVGLLFIGLGAGAIAMLVAAG